MNDINKILNNELKENLKSFTDDLTQEAKKIKEKKIDWNDIWEEEPVNIIDFCKDFIGESLFEGEQKKAAIKTIGENPIKWKKDKFRGYLFWGKGSGKDRTIAKLINYIAYKLRCMKNPQVYFGLGKDAPIDIINIAKTGPQATNTFFDPNLKPILEMTINPKTHNNWWEEKGVRLEERFAIQKNKISFGNNITAHSLNHEKWSMEGLSVLFAVCDEIGSWKPEKGLKIIDAIEDSIISRFGSYGKLLCISYKYDKNCLMSHLVKTAEKEIEEAEKKKEKTDTFISRGKTWEVNSKKKNLKNLPRIKKKYIKNPVRSIYTYECEEVKDVSLTDDFIKMKNRIYDSIRDVENPFVNDVENVISSQLKSLKFKDWFKRKKNRKYYVHVDGSKGGEGNDKSGFVMCHREKFKPYFSKEYIEFQKKYGINVEEEKYKKENGIVEDIQLQIRAPEETNEIILKDIRDFIFILKKKGFDIECATFDGWQSLDGKQQLKTKGIDSEILSVDRNKGPYEFYRDLLYSGMLKTYHHKTAIRELEELVEGDKKIDHPELSVKRYEEEGIEEGSKDVSDAKVAAAFKCYNAPEKEFVFG